MELYPLLSVKLKTYTVAKAFSIIYLDMSFLFFSTGTADKRSIQLGSLKVGQHSFDHIITLITSQPLNDRKSEYGIQTQILSPTLRGDHQKVGVQRKKNKKTPTCCCIAMLFMASCYVVGSLQVTSCGV